MQQGSLEEAIRYADLKQARVLGIKMSAKDRFDWMQLMKLHDQREVNKRRQEAVYLKSCRVVLSTLK